MVVKPRLPLQTHTYTQMLGRGVGFRLVTLVLSFMFNRKKVGLVDLSTFYSELGTWGFLKIWIEISGKTC